MKKIMFNDKYGLTEAVLEGRKTMTRRIVPEKLVDSYCDYNDYVCAVAPSGIPYKREYEKEFFLHRSPFKVGEVIKVAQNLRDMGYDPRSRNWGRGEIWGLDHTPAWTNKMFVRAEDCIHEILITNVRVERMQDISDEDVYREGFSREVVNNGWGNAAYHWETMLVYYDSLGRTKEIRSPYPREAFAALIDRLSGKGTWESNPWVFVYEFELVK